MNEITIAQQGSVTCDFETIKAGLNEKLELYRGMVFTEDAKKDAKKVVAELRKEKKEFTDRVKEVKTEFMKPYEAFYEKACELIDMYDEPITFINGQIDAFEEKRIAEKKEIIKAIYTEMVPEEDMIDLIPLQRIYNAKWENATFEEKAIKEEIMQRKIAAKEAIETIKSMGSEKESTAIEMYKQNYNLTDCILYLNNYEKQKREFEERERARIQQETEERIRAEERAKIEAEQQKAAEIEQAKQEAVEALIPEVTNEETIAYSYIINMTTAEKEKLELYMNSVGINFEEINF